MFEVHIWRGKRPFSMSNVRINDIRKNKIHTDMSNMAMAWLVRDPATWQPLAMDASSRNPSFTLFDKSWEIKISSYLLQYMYVLSMSTDDRAFPQREQKDEGEGARELLWTHGRLHPGSTTAQCGTVTVVVMESPKRIMNSSNYYWIRLSNEF